jgi:hypothetical protein
VQGSFGAENAPQDDNVYFKGMLGDVAEERYEKKSMGRDADQELQEAGGMGGAGVCDAGD